MGLPTSSYGRRTARPAARTWQEGQEIDAQDQWNSRRPGIEADQTRAGAQRDRTRGAADSALDTFNKGGSTNVQNYAPLNIQGYSPSQLASWQTAAAGAAALASGGRSALAGAQSQVPGGGGEELAKYSADDVSNFDPSQYGGEYFKGAQGEFERGLHDDLDYLTDSSVGRGRLSTGFFDKDRGSVVNRNSDQFADKLSQAATTFSGQRLDALSTGADLRFRRASEMDENAIQSGEARDRFTLGAGEATDRFSLDQGDQGLEYAKLGLDAAEFGDEQNYRRASDLDRYGFDRARYIDDQSFDRGKTGLDAALDRERGYMDDYHKYADRTADYDSSTRDWAAQDRELQDTRDAAAVRNRPQPMRAGRPVMGAAEKAARAQAAALHVPYHG